MIQKLSRPELEQLTNAFYDDVPSEDRDEMAIPSYLHWNPLIRWLMWRRYASITQLAGFSAADTVLEFGCGAGVFLPELCAHTSSVYAIDLFPQFAQSLAAKRNLSVQFVDDLADLQEASLDMIVAADVLEHIHDVPSLLEVFHRKLKPGGALLVSGPTENFVYRLGRIVAGFAGKGDYHHTNIQALFALISQNGFVTKAQINLPFTLPPHLFWVGRFERVEA